MESVRLQKYQMITIQVKNNRREELLELCGYREHYKHGHGFVYQLPSNKYNNDRFHAYLVGDTLIQIHLDRLSKKKRHFVPLQSFVFEREEEARIKNRKAYMNGRTDKPKDVVVANVADVVRNFKGGIIKKAPLWKRFLNLWNV